MISKVVILCLAIASTCGVPFRRTYQPEVRYETVQVAQPKIVYQAAPVIQKQIIEAPEPYEMSFDIVDEYGNRQSRQESGDAYGNKQGSYSMTDSNGLSRQVSYVADDNGVRMVVVTNEPGTSNDSPADVQMKANPVEVVQSYQPRQVVVQEQPRYY